MRQWISSGSVFEEQIGYARAVRDGRWVFVSGTTGYDYETMTLPPGVADQCRQTIENLRSALTEAGATLDDVVRVTYILPERDDFEACWPILSQAFGRARPAATMLVAGLYRPEMKIEIEATALIPGSDA